MRYLICYDTRWINKLAPAFPTPALRKEREGPGTHCVPDASEFKGWATRPLSGRLQSIIVTRKMGDKVNDTLAGGPG